jgi:hypothetical protein
MLNLSYDFLTCWLRPLEEAKGIQLLQEEHLHHTSQKFFALFCSEQDQTSSGKDSAYSPLTLTDDTSTVTTNTITTNTTQSSETTDFSSKSSTAYLGLFQDNSDIRIFLMTPFLTTPIHLYLLTNLLKSPSYTLTFTNHML